MRRRMLGARTATLTLGVLWVAASACYQHSFTIGDGAPTAPVVDEEWHHHWLWGLISPDSELRLSDECTSEDATIEAEETFLNGLVAVLTGGIYSPTTVRVRCANGTASLDLDERAIAQIVSAPEFLAWVDAVLPDRLDEAAVAQRDWLAQ